MMRLELKRKAANGGDERILGDKQFRERWRRNTSLYNEGKKIEKKRDKYSMKEGRRKEEPNERREGDT